MEMTTEEALGRLLEAIRDAPLSNEAVSKIPGIDRDESMSLMNELLKRGIYDALEAGRLHMSVEFAELKPEHEPFFTDVERAEARRWITDWIPYVSEDGGGQGFDVIEYTGKLRSRAPSSSVGE